MSIENMPLEMDYLIKFANMFLVSNGLFFAALGAAETSNDKLKAGLSVGGIIVSFCWFICATNFEFSQIPIDVRGKILIFLPIIFTLGWLLSAYIHFRNWYRK